MIMLKLKRFIKDRIYLSTKTVFMSRNLRKVLCNV